VKNLFLTDKLKTFGWGGDALQRRFQRLKLAAIERAPIACLFSIWVPPPESEKCMFQEAQQSAPSKTHMDAMEAFLTGKINWIFVSERSQCEAPKRHNKPHTKQL
jgi:hypothetical protein